MTDEEIEEKLTRGEIRVAPRVAMKHRPVGQRASSFQEVNLGYTEEEAKAEAARCLACGVCSECLCCYYKCGVGRDPARHGGARGRGSGRLPHSGSRVRYLQRPAFAGIRPGTIPQRGQRPPIRANPFRFRPHHGPREPAVRRQGSAKDRFHPVRGQPRPGAPVLLGGLLHVRHEGSDHRQGTRERDRSRPSSSSTSAPTAKGSTAITRGPARNTASAMCVRMASRVAEDPRTRNLRISYHGRSRRNPGGRVRPGRPFRRHGPGGVHEESGSEP